jgi:hypothetical protein
MLKEPVIQNKDIPKEFDYDSFWITMLEFLMKDKSGTLFDFVNQYNRQQAFNFINNNMSVIPFDIKNMIHRIYESIRLENGGA